ncbi:hypothetical protein A2U06_00065 [Fusobacterium necrophorum subsp. funduliforme]|uniref:hypothetical protein n=1 Tax=Fusobacterium necrophorum TaxID=859 RepID=UPI0007898E25|nr:hypothetical protein [Fusobacterium necrophorum]KYM54193.1 hypothetical protein A2U06_00065 [Fusobacterium necrophorum subsp. funduliforme]KYM62408.1 hypothetical protein A2U09_10110 [Fusobacterium necrophorum subsp. funduliforme]MDK4471158.1 hypothetical protein [Fusobacterium necrophorum]MDK4473075.1 hypothetical protein [Fusobacterium necrophorum]MDK4478527.1 hypothetical protein [Fusobacterium necrophorum]
MQKRETLEVNGHKITLVEQPTQYILDLEKRFEDKELVGYCKEILKYPAGENSDMTEFLNIPDVVKYQDLELSLKDKEGKKDLYLAQELFTALGKNKPNTAYVAEVFLQKLGKNVNDFKYKELVDMGAEVFKQVGEMIYLIKIRDTFRSL